MLEPRRRERTFIDFIGNQDMGACRDSEQLHRDRWIYTKKSEGERKKKLGTDRERIGFHLGLAGRETKYFSLIRPDTHPIHN